MSKSLTLETAQAAVIKKIAHLRLISFINRKSLATFIDSEYGKFDGNYAEVLKGRSHHPDRSKANRQVGVEKRKKTNLDKYGAEFPQTCKSKIDFKLVYSKLNCRHSHLKLISYSGSKKDAEFFDKDFGKFIGKYERVFAGSKVHPKRSLMNRKIALNCPEVIEKRNNTVLQRYGVKNAAQSEEIQKKIIKTSLKRYGTIRPSQSKIIKDKVKKTCQTLYGQDHVFQIPEIKIRISNTNMKKYGTIYPNQSEIVKEKKKKTNQEKRGVDFSFQDPGVKVRIKKSILLKYGTDCVLKNKDVQNKSDQTKLKKYGTLFPSQTTVIKNKIKATNMLKRGVEHAFQDPIVKNKAKRTINKKYGTEFVSQNDDIKKQIKQTNIDSGYWYDFDGLTAKDYFNVQNLPGGYTTFLQNINKYGKNIAITLSPNQTTIEYAIECFLKGELVSFISNKMLSGTKYKPDFLLPDYNLIIECDGLYWHSDSVKKNNNYHRAKSNIYHALGYQSLFFREDEILNKTKIVESIILAKLGKISERVFARKCKFEIMDTKTSAKFFEENYLMSKCSGQTYALIYDGEVVSAMSIVTKKDHIEISRFCNRLNTYVLGGFSELMKLALLETDKKKVISFVDMRYGNGHSLTKLGFEEKSNHLSFKWTDFKKTYHCSCYPKKSGYSKGLYKVFDCGQKKFELIVSN